MCSINRPEVGMSKGDGREERRDEVRGDEQCRNDDVGTRSEEMNSVEMMT